QTGVYFREHITFRTLSVSIFAVLISRLDQQSSKQWKGETVLEIATDWSFSNCVSKQHCYSNELTIWRTNTYERDRDLRHRG
ncbi:hypothetical protein L916_17543, partial [Phytophthora nicotianae]